MSEMAISQYFRNDVIKSRFAEIVGDHNAGAYIASVLLAVANDQSGLLRQATPESIYVSALRAASLRLSVDPSTGQAYLVPFRNKGEQTATLIVGYKGLYDMAVRTGKYRYINVGKVYQGENIIEDRITGFHQIAGNKTGETIIGWLGAFEMNNRYAKTIYMTVEEIHEHAKKYSKSYDNPKGIWKVNQQAMEKKTVLRILLRQWGYLDPSDAAIVDQVDEDNQTFDIEATDVHTGEIAIEQETEAETLASLGFEAEELKETKSVGRPTTTATVTPPAPQTMSLRYTPEQLKGRIAEFVKTFEEQGFKPTVAQRQTLPGNIEMCFPGMDGVDKIHHSVTKYLVGKVSTKDMTDAEVMALRKWLNVTKDSGGEWLPDAMAAKEAAAIWRQCQIDNGQRELIGSDDLDYLSSEKIS